MVIPVTNGLVLQLETDSGVTASSGTVTGWGDSSGQGNDLTAAGDPTIGTVTTPTGAAAIALDGDGDFLERVAALSGLPEGDENRTVFFVVDYVDPQGVTAGVVFGDNRKNEAFGLTADVDNDLLVQGFGGANDFDAPVDGVSPGWLVQSAVVDGGVLQHYLNGGSVDSVSHTYNTDLQRLVIGEEIGGLGQSALNVSAVLVYDRALTTQERQQVESYLQTKYLLDGDPIASDDTVGVTPGDTVAIDVLDNDVDDAPLDGSSISIVDGPDNGSILSIDAASGVVTYSHNGGPSTSDSFTYQLTDGDGNVSNIATVSVDVGIQPLSLDGFTDEQVVTRAVLSPGFLPISMTFLPDNRMLLLSKNGEIRIVDPATGSNSLYMTINNIDDGQERGLLDITLDPDFENNGYFYLYYTPDSPENARIARFTHEESSGGLTSTGNLSSELVVWEDTDGYLSCCHYGGGLDFGPDGKLWLTTSDKFQATTPGEGPSGGEDIMLNLASSSGKIIRINSDGTIPDGTDGWAANPFIDGPGGNDDSIWAYGLRNPFRMRFDEETGNAYIGEVGGNQQNVAHDDVHVAGLDQPGAFYGWPFYEGTPNTYVNDGQSNADPNDFPLPDNDLADPANGDFYSAPIWSLDHQGQSASLTGGEVYRGNLFPNEWNGVYFYGDYTRDNIRYLLLDETGTQVLGDFDFKPSVQIPGTTNEVVSIAVGNDGALYYAMIASGEIRRITFDGNAAPDITSADVTPTDGDAPLAVVFDASVIDPEGDTLTYTLNFGDGTVFNGNVAESGVISQNHTYDEDGRFNVSLSVSDGINTSFSQAFEVEVGDVNFAPVITDETSDVAIAAAGDTEVTFSAMATDPDNDQITYVWYFGDGNTAAGTVDTSGVVTATHVYQTEGTFNAFLEVTDGTETTFSDDVPLQVGVASQVPVTDGLVLLLQSDIKIGLGNGNTVTAWLDGSGNGNNLFAEGDPQLVENVTPTGQSAIVFDGQDDLLQRVNASDTIFNLSTGSDDRTMFVVVNYIDNEGVSAGAVYGDGTKNETFGLVSDYDGGDLGVQGFGRRNDFDSGVDAASQGWIVQSVTLSNDQYNHYLDGGLIDSGTHTFNTDLKKLVLGAEINGAGESELEIGAVLIYDRTLNEAERQQVEDFLQNKYITGDGNASPVAADDSGTVGENGVVNIDVLANDTDADLDTLSVTGVNTGGTLGLVSINPDGTISYDPNGQFEALDAGQTATDSFTYTVSDGQGGSDQATVTVTIDGADEQPVAISLFLINADTDTEIGPVPANGQIDPSQLPVGTPFAIEARVDEGQIGPVGSVIFNFSGGINGSETENAAPYASFGKSGSDFSGQPFPAAGFTLTVTAYSGSNGSGSVLGSIQGLTITTGNSAPVAEDDVFVFNEDNVLNGDVLADNGNGADSDVDGDTLVATLMADVSSGALVLNTDGTFAYTPDADFAGTDSFTYQVSDGAGGTDQATVSITVDPVDDPAMAANDSYATELDTPLLLDASMGVLANDSDVEGDPFTATLVSDVSDGTLVLNTDGSLTYTPDAGFTGTDSFTYQVTGGDTAVVNISVDDGAADLVTDGLVAAYSAAENVSTGVGNTVTGWLDGSGRGNDLVAGGDPTLVAGLTPTGEAAIVFDGTDDFLERVNAIDTLNGLVDGSGDRTMFFVVNYIDDQGVSSGLVYGDGSKNEAFGLVTAKDGHLEVQGFGGRNDFDSGVNAAASGWMVQSVVLDDDTFNHYQNGTLIDSDTHVFNTDLERLVIGEEINDLGEAEMQVAGALIYDRALNETERMEVETYLQQLYIEDNFVFV